MIKDNIKLKVLISHLQPIIFYTYYIFLPKAMHYFYIIFLFRVD